MVIEAVYSCGVLAFCVIGWFFYPRCLDDAIDCCDRTCIREQGNNLILDEATAEIIYDTDQYYCIGTGAAKLIQLGDSPQLRNQVHIPIAKSLKIN
jgi:hypothetical protein